MRLRKIVKYVACSGVLGAVFLGSGQRVYADDHLPILDITPTLGWSVTGNGGDPPITPGWLPNTPSDPNRPSTAPGNPPAENGFLTFNGTATLPIFKNFSISYDRIGNGAFDSLLSSFSVPIPNSGGKTATVYPGGNTDLLQNYRADYHVGHFTIEGGFGSRYRQCCPADYLEWHKGFFGVTYATPHFNFLNHGFLVLDVTGNAVNYHKSPDIVAILTARGYPILHQEVYTTQQAITAVIPVSPRIGIRSATTFLWGALDYPEHGPFPQYYDVFITSVTKQVTHELGLTATIANVIQRSMQGYPFPAGTGIRTAALTIAANFHVDFNKILAAPATQTPPQRTTVPGVPGGPGGPVPIITPSPAPSPSR